MPDQPLESSVDQKSPPRRRSAKACLYCHNRKTRCDASAGIPCTNCRWFKHDCIFTESKYTRRRRGYIFREVKPKYRRYQKKGKQQISADHNENNLSADADQARVSAHSNVFNRHALNVAASGSSSKSRTSHLDTETQDLDLPHYISPLSPGSSAVDRRRLQAEGALEIPADELRDAILGCFTLFVHPFLPVIDLEDFVSRIQADGRNGTVSLLLTQAVMFAASGYVDICTLKKHGYNSPKEARMTFFNRANLIYSLDCEDDNLALLQSSLLMTLVSDNSGLMTQTRNFIAVAIELAQSISQGPMMGISHGLWKRIMWTCYMRDRILAISFQTPTIIRDEEFRTVPLKLEDFSTQSWPKNAAWLLQHIEAPSWNFSGTRTLSKFCIALAECCRCIPHLSTLKPRAQNGEARETQSLVDISGSRTAEIARRVKELEKGYNAFPRDLQWSMAPFPRVINCRLNDAIIVHRAVLTGVMLVVKSALCHHALACKGTLPHLNLDLNHCLNETALQLANIFQQLNDNGLVSYLPDTAVVMLEAAIITPPTGSKALDQIGVNLGQLSTTRLDLFTDIVQQLKKLYILDDSLSSVVDKQTHRPGSLSLVGRDTNVESSYGTNIAVDEASAQPLYPNGDAVIPALLTATPESVDQLEGLSMYGATTSFLSAVNLMPQERALLLQLSGSS